MLPSQVKTFIHLFVMDTGYTLNSGDTKLNEMWLLLLRVYNRQKHANNENTVV